MNYSRRQLLKIGAASCAGASLGLIPQIGKGADNRFADPAKGPGHVVKVHMPGMRGRFFPHAKAAQIMVNKAVMKLSGQSDVKSAFGKFITRKDKVGIKINCLGGRMSSTSKEVTDAIVEGVKKVGVPDENIMIFDQFGGNMRGARYLWEERPGFLRVINHDVLGYETNWTKAGSARGKLAKTFTWATAIINVPVIKDHDLAGAGISCSMKNMVFGCVERPYIMHSEIATAIPHFYSIKEIQSRVRLIIVDGSFCLYDGGPKHNFKAHVTHDCIYASTDPVAVDSIAYQVVESERKKNGLKTLDEVNRPASFLKIAQDLGLGIADSDKIYLETINLPPYLQPSA